MSHLFVKTNRPELLYLDTISFFMESILHLLLVSFGALLMVSIFQFSIYIQQKDKAFLYYSLYLLVMIAYIATRLLDARITNIYPLSYHVVETLDPLLSITGFLMYINFLRVILNITKAEKFYYTSWRFLQIFIVSVLIVYSIFQIFKISAQVSDALIIICSFVIMVYGTILAFRLFRFINEIFFKLIIIGTVIAVIGAFSGMLVNIFIIKDKLAFEGLYFLLPAIMIEAIFLSAALGYRLKLAYKEKNQAQQKLILETKRNEQLALQTASLLQRELNVHDLQKRISQDLHDDVGASLSSIHIYSAVAKKLMDAEPEKAKEILEQISDNAHLVIDNMSDIIWSMKTDTEEANFSAKIKNVGYELLNAANIECSYLIDNELNNSFREINVRRNIYLIIKEAFNNIAKYSQATKASVKVYRQDNTVKIIIKDNGKGFDFCTTKRGNGIKNMQHRAKLLEGECKLETATGKGTVISCSFPITIFSDISESTL
jgi:signal transduction histidine kinase